MPLKGLVEEQENTCPSSKSHKLGSRCAPPSARADRSPEHGACSHACSHACCTRLLYPPRQHLGSTWAAPGHPPLHHLGTQLGTHVPLSCRRTTWVPCRLPQTRCSPHNTHTRHTHTTHTHDTLLTAATSCPCCSAAPPGPCVPRAPNLVRGPFPRDHF